MRVISGSARGLKLLSPDGMGTRPTTDRVKEALFNIIQPYIPANAVLDLFSGSGALGIEALSRGSEAATFVDLDKAAIDIIKKNLEKARLTQRARVVNSDAFSFLSTCKTGFDLIFLDPPYNKGFLDKVFDIISEKKLLNAGGLIVLESEAGGENVERDDFSLIKTAKYGKTTLSFFTI